MTRRRWAGALVALALFAGPPSTASAEDWSWGLLAGGDAGLSPDTVGNGFFMVEARRPIGHGGTLFLQYHTDTVAIGVEDISLAPRFVFSARARGEAFYAGLLPRYYVEGREQQAAEFGSALGLYASYAALETELKWYPHAGHTLALRANARRWFFSPVDDRPVDYVEPAEPWVIEPRLAWTFWALDGAMTEFGAHRLAPRIEGFASSIVIGVDIRTEHHAWGIVDADTGAPGRRNQGGQFPARAEGWVYFGAHPTETMRVRGQGQARWGWNEDDISRARLGGMTPYVMPLPGLPWASVISARAMSSQIGLSRAIEAHEIGGGLAAAIFSDPRRTGAIDRVGAAAGAYLSADLRFGKWAVDLRLGTAFPTRWLEGDPYVSALGAVSAFFP